MNLLELLKKKNRIVLVSHTIGLYGANRNNLSIGISLKNQGYKVFFFVPAKDTFCQQLKNNKLQYYAFNRFNRYLYWVKKHNESKMTTLIRSIRNIISLFFSSFLIIIIRPEFIISLSSTINIGSKLARLFNIKHIWYLQEFLEEDYNYTFKYGTRYGYEYINRNSDAIVTISKSLFNKVNGYINNKNNRLHLVYNGIQDLNVNKNLIVQNKIVFLFIGSLIHGKRPQDILHAIELLSDDLKLKSQFVYLGDGYLKYYLIERCKELNLNNVFFLGFQENIKPFLEKSHVGLVSSQNEAFGLVTIEYMMAKMPIIGSKSGGTTELIQNMTNGLLYDTGDIYQLKECLTFFINNPKEINRMGNKSYHIFRSNYTTENYNKIGMIISNLRR